jgi:hypothetical protein
MRDTTSSRSRRKHIAPNPPRASVCSPLAALTSDPHNANRGTDRGRAALDRSLREYGAGRAVLIDRHGRIIAGNKTVEQAKRLNLPLHVVKTDGTFLIAVQREDLDLVTDPRAKALAIADNRVSELDLEWDLDVLKHLQAEGLDLSAFWTDAELAELFADPTTGLTDENAVVEPRPTDIVRGELFELGRHRLLCGDATSAGDSPPVAAAASSIAAAWTGRIFISTSVTKEPLNSPQGGYPENQLGRTRRRLPLCAVESLSWPHQVAHWLVDRPV